MVREFRPLEHQDVAVPGCRLEVQPANNEVAFVFPCRYPGKGLAGDGELADLGPEASGVAGDEGDDTVE
ncbi:MAG: hypothetical protein ACREXX_19535 [Gammaproteobacteria bacterium]